MLIIKNLDDYLYPNKSNIFYIRNNRNRVNAENDELIDLLIEDIRYFCFLNKDKSVYLKLFPNFCREISIFERICRVLHFIEAPNNDELELKAIINSIILLKSKSELFKFLHNRETFIKRLENDLENKNTANLLQLIFDYKPFFFSIFDIQYENILHKAVS